MLKKNSIFSKTNIFLFSREKSLQCKWISCRWARWVLLAQKHWIHFFSLLPCACLHSSSSTGWYVPKANLFILLLCWLLVHFFRTTIFSTAHLSSPLHCGFTAGQPKGPLSRMFLTDELQKHLSVCMHGFSNSVWFNLMPEWAGMCSK